MGCHLNLYSMPTVFYFSIIMLEQFTWHTFVKVTYTENHPPYCVTKDISGLFYHLRVLHSFLAVATTVFPGIFWSSQFRSHSPDCFQYYKRVREDVEGFSSPSTSSLTLLSAFSISQALNFSLLLLLSLWSSSSLCPPRLSHSPEVLGHVPIYRSPYQGLPCCAEAV